MWKLVYAQPIVIPASQFPQVSAPSNDMRFLMVYPPGGLSTNPQLGSNATISYANLVRVLELVLTNTSGGGGGGKVSVYSNGVPLVGVASNLNFTDFYTNPSSNGGTATIDLGASTTTANINTSSNLVYSTLIAGSSGFVVLCSSNTSSLGIQSLLNGMTNGGTLSVQQGLYDITNQIKITNASILIQGNLARWKYHIGLTNFMVVTPTNYSKQLVIQDLIFDGGVPAPYLSSVYAPGLGGNYNPYLNQFWTNRSGLRVEVSGGVVIRGCTFTCWPGNGLMLLNITGSLSQSYPRAFVINNIFATNFIGCYLPAQNYEIPGYYNSDSSLWNLLQPEYSQVIDNQFWANQTAIVPEAGNATVTGNIINSNYVGMFFQPGANEGHGDYSVNNLNHNIYPIYWQGGPGNAGTFNNNMIYQDSAGGVVFSDAINIQFKHNILQNTPLIFTNGCQGEVAYNTYGQGFGDRWGVDITTNFTGSPLLRVYGNQGSLGTNHDGSASSVSAFTTNFPFAGAVWVSPDGVHGQWTNFPPSSGGSGSLFPPNAAGVLTNNGAGVTNWLSIQMIVNGASNNAVSSLPSQTNFIAFDWSGSPTLTNAGLIPVFAGFNAAGDLLVKGTNYPTGGGSTPNGLVTNNGTVTVLVPGLNITNTSPAQSENLFGAIGAVTVPPSVANHGVLFVQAKTNGTTAASSAVAATSLLVQGPRGVLSLGTDVQMLSTNSTTQTYQWWDTNNIVHMGSNNVETITITPSSGTIQGNTLIALGGSVSVIPTNAAPVYTSNGLTGALPFGLTNTLQGRCQYLVGYYIVDAVGGTPILTVSNELDGYKYPPISLGASASITPGTNWFTTPILSTNTVLRIRDESAGSGASVGLISSKMIGL